MNHDHLGKEGSSGRPSRSCVTCYRTRGSGSQADRDSKTNRHGLLAGDDDTSHRRRPSSLKGGNRCAGMGAPSWPGPALPNTCEADKSLQFLTHPIPIDTPRCQHPTTPGVRPSTRASGAHDHRPSAANRKRDRNRGVDAPQTSAAEYNAGCAVLPVRRGMDGTRDRAQQITRRCTCLLHIWRPLLPRRPERTALP